MRFATEVSMKLCVEPKSSRAVKVAWPMRTRSCIVLLVRGHMPISA
jgi:hypothetical protein